MFWATATTKNINEEAQIHAKVDGKKRKQKPSKTRRKDTELPQTSVPTKVVADKAVYEEMYANVERDATTATSLDAKRDRGIISKTQFTATLNEPSSIRTSSGSGPRRQETMGDAADQTSLDEDHASKQERNIADIDAYAETTLVDETAEDQGRYNDQEMFDTGVLDEEEVFIEKEVAVKEVDVAQDQKAFNKTMSWINSFVPMESEVVKDRAEGSKIRAEESSKRAWEDLQQESTKKQKVDDDKEAAKLKRCLEIVHDDEDDVTIDATSFSFKSPTIIDYKIHKEGRKISAASTKFMLPVEVSTADAS
nr:hypothetical protein [Tanacetum cinerariifolium]